MKTKNNQKLISFKTNVYKICSFIPKGKVATYGQLAKLAGKPRAARAVGVFMKNNPDVPQTPGKLTGYSGLGGIAQKKEMLLKEGVCFKNDRVDLAVSQWKK